MRFGKFVKECKERNIIHPNGSCTDEYGDRHWLEISRSGIKVDKISLITRKSDGQKIIVDSLTGLDANRAFRAIHNILNK